MLEQLETRTMLAGGFTTAPISDAQMVALLDGLDGLAAFGSELSATGELAAPLALLTVPGDEPITIHGLLDVGDVLDAKLSGPVRTYLEGLGPADRTTNALVAFLDSLPEVTSITGGLATMPADELRFEMTFQTEVQVAGLGIDLGPQGDALGLIDCLDCLMTSFMNIQFAFGVDRNSELNSEQAFFVRGTTIDVAVDMHVPRGVIGEEGMSYTVGFLEGDVADGEIDLDADLHVTLNNIVPDVLGNVTLSELNGYAASELADIDVTANSVAATFDVTTTVGSWTPAGTPQIMVSGSAIGSDPTVSTSADFAELLNFNNVDAEQMLLGLDLFGSWLAGFADSSLLDVDVPFAAGATLGGLYDDDWEVPVVLRDPNGQPVFDSLQSFASAVGSGIDYDPAANRLVFPMTRNFAPRQSTANIVVLNEKGTTVYLLATDSLVTLTATSVVDFDLGVDLSLPGQLPEQQFSAEGLVVQGSVYEDKTDSDIVSSARYGIVGIDFAGGTLAGTSAFRADIVNPNTGDSRATLGELLAGLGTPDTLLGQPLQLSGSTSLVLDGLSVQDGLFTVPAGASIRFDTEVTDYPEGGGVTAPVETDIGLLANFANLTEEFIVESIVTGLTEASKWAGPTINALQSFRLSLDELDDAVINSVADAVQTCFDAFEAATNAPARLQDIATVLVQYCSSDSGNYSVGRDVDFTVNLAVDELAAALNLEVTLSAGSAVESVPVGLDINYLSGVPGGENLQGIGEFAGTFDPVEAESVYTWHEDFLLDLSTPATPQAFLLTTSELTVEAYVEAPAAGATLEAEGSIGVLGVSWDPCGLVIAADRLMPDPAAPATFTVGLADSAPDGRVALDQLASADLETSATGQADVDCHVTVAPSTLPESDPFHFRIGNLDRPLLTTAFVGELPDFPTLAAGVDLPDDLEALPSGLHELLDRVAAALDIGVFGLGFPLVGDALASVANFINDLRDKLDAAFDATVGFACDQIEDAIESGLGLGDEQLVPDCTNPDDIRFTLDLDGVPISKPLTVLHSDLGLPLLGATIDAELQLEVFYDVQLTFGVSVADGVYIDTASDILTAGVRVDLIENATGPELSGTLGFVKVNVENTSSSPTVFDLNFTIDLTDPNNNGRLTVPEIIAAAGDPGSLIDEATTGVTGGVALELKATAEVVEFLPSIEADIAITWEFDGTDLRGSTPEVTLDVGLNVGTFLSQVLLPVLEPLQDFLGTEPGKLGLDDVLGVLTDPLPIISELIGPTSIVDVAAALLPAPYDAIPRAIDALGFVVGTAAQLVGAAEAQAGNSTVLHFGELRFGTPETSGFDARDANQAIDLAAQVYEDQTDSDFVSQLLDAAGRGVPGSFGELSQQVIDTEGASLDFPFLKQPLSVFEFLLGIGDAEIVTFKFPSIDGTIPFDLTVPIFLGILKAGIFGGIDVHASLAVGYDTFGFREFVRTGDVADLSKGFYISDGENADGTGEDIAEFSIGGDILAGLVLDAVVASAGVGGGVFAELAADFIDPDADGKIRGHELVPHEGCLELEGTIGVKLEAFVELLGFIRKDFPFARAELGGFNTTVPCFGGADDANETGDRIAELDSDGVLKLFIGPNADRRTVNPLSIDETFFVSQAGPDIVVQAYGVAQRFDAAAVDRISGYGAEGNDTIIIDVSVTKPVELTGGPGNDELQGGQGGDDIDGGSGDDTVAGNDGADRLSGGADADVIDGGSGPDTIDAGFGDDLVLGGDDADSLTAGAGHDTVSGGNENSPGDTIDGGAGDDLIFGGDGDDSITTGDGANIAYGDAGRDIIDGGADRDALYGGVDDDILSGADGDDVILGDDGDDVLFGNDGADLMDGGSGGDTLDGGADSDVLYGGGDADELNGRHGAEYIEGGAGNDTISGGNGVDTVRGGADDDVIRGNEDDDLLFGEHGDDEIHGQTGADLIEGGPDNDDLFGGDDSDLIRGGGGNDDIEGGDAGDELYGDDGSDTIDGDGGAGNNATCDAEPGSDRDTIYGGADGDEIKGDCDDDLIFGEDGSDEIEGNDGADTIEAGTGDDELSGDAGSDSLKGGDGDDRIDGGSEDDSARGGNGNDLVLGSDGADALYGDSGDDMIDGGEQPDLIDGGADDDHLIGTGDVDQIFGNVGRDLIEGNAGGDVLRGNDGEDLIYGDGGDDDIAGGPDNDTIRGGDDNDTARGGAGDDLVLGHTGDDELFGDAGNDALYGYLGDDILTGGADNDRAFGQLGNDLLAGDDGDDILEGGPGDDTASGGDGNDALYGDGGVDSLSGGDDDDFIFAGDGVGDMLYGDGGNDHIVGSDEGSEDPNFADTIFFGDVIDGGEGDDFIEGLGGSDIINGDTGIDSVYGGTHADQITDLSSEANVIEEGAPLPTLAVSTGLELGGHWVELSGSASAGGLTQVGGFEQAVFATDAGVYVAWVDWRSGNSEIYLAFHASDVAAPTGDWIELDGSASGGGISRDATQSRRPTIVEVQSLDANAKPVAELLVAWTKIDAAGTRSIEVRRLDDLVGWDFVVPSPAPVGSVDDPQWVRHSDSSALLGWIESSATGDRVGVAQYVRLPGNSPGSFPVSVGVSRLTPPPGTDITGYDLATDGYHTAVVYSHGDPGDHEVSVGVAGFAITDLCAGPTDCPFPTVAPAWRELGNFTDDNAIEPTIGMRFVRLEGELDVESEVRVESDVYVAWHQISDREDQVVGMLRRIEGISGGGGGAVASWEPLVPQYFGEAPRLGATSVSETIGYAAKPDLAAECVESDCRLVFPGGAVPVELETDVLLAWMDDGVHGGPRGDGTGRSSVFVLLGRGDGSILTERLPHDASGSGISPTGGSTDSISIVRTVAAGSMEAPPIDGAGFVAHETAIYVAWTDHAAGDPVQSGPGATQVMLRTDLDLPLVAVRVRQTGGSTRVTEGGAADTYSIVLMSEPAGDVLVTLAADPAHFTVSPATLLFEEDDWETPKIVTVSAVDDGTPERRLSSTITHTVTSSDVNYDGIGVASVSVQIVDNDFSIPQVEPIMRAARRRPALIGYGLTTTGVVDPASADDEANYSLVQPSRRRPKTVAIQSVAYDAATETVQLNAAAALKANTFYQLTVSNIPSPGDSFTIQIGVGTTLSYADASGDTVGLQITNGSIVVTRDTTGEGQFLGVFPTAPTSELSGTVRRPRRGTSDGRTTFRSMSVEPGRTFTNTLTNPPFRIGPLDQATIDELLTASGGTLAQILSSL